MQDFLETNCLLTRSRFRESDDHLWISILLVWIGLLGWMGWHYGFRNSKLVNVAYLLHGMTLCVTLTPHRHQVPCHNTLVSLLMGASYFKRESREGLWPIYPECWRSSQIEAKYSANVRTSRNLWHIIVQSSPCIITWSTEDLRHIKSYKK